MSARGTLQRRDTSPALVRRRADVLDVAPWAVWGAGMVVLGYWAFFVITNFRQIGAPLACAIALTLVTRLASRRISVVTQRMRMGAALDVLDTLPPAGARDHLPPEAVDLLAHLHHLVVEMAEGTARDPKRVAWEWLGELSRLSESARARLEAAGVDVGAIEQTVKAALGGSLDDLRRAVTEAERALTSPPSAGYR